jgi:hypothetical protein
MSTRKAAGEMLMDGLPFPITVEARFVVKFGFNLRMNWLLPGFE